jgi:hypothetical protein
METLPELNRTRISLDLWPGILQPVFGGLGSEAAKELHVMNVTLMTAKRRDGHPAVYMCSRRQGCRLGRGWTCV